MIDLMQRLAELDAGNPNVIREGQDSPTLQQLKAMLQKYSGTPFIFQLNKRIADQQWREANGKGDPVDASGRPVPVLSPEEFQKKYPTYLKTGEKPAPATDGKKNWLVTPDEAKASQDAEAAAQFTLKENAELAECGMMPMPGMGGQPHTPASISMTANSGPELSGMLADIMKLAGVHQVEPAHLGIEHEPAVLTAEPSMDLDHDHSNGEIMRSVMDKMNPDMDDEEETDEGMWDNSPADTEPPAPFDANEFAHRENQPGQGDRMDGDKPKGFPTMEEQLMADWKQFMTEGVAEGLDKEALHQELLKINQQMKLNHPRYNNPNSPGHTDRYFELMKKKDAIIAQLKKGVAEGDSGAKYRVKTVGNDVNPATDERCDYYINPITDKKVYCKPGQKVSKGDHVNPTTGKVTPKV